MGGFSEKLLWFFTIASLVVGVCGTFLPYASLGVSKELARGVVFTAFGIFIVLVIVLFVNFFRHVIKPRIQEIKGRIQEIKHMMWPIILMCSGIFLFVVLFGGGAIWFYKIISVTAQSPPQSAMTNKSYDAFMKSQDSLNKFYDAFTKKQARLPILINDQERLESLIKNYEELESHYLKCSQIDDLMRVHAISNIMLIVDNIKSIAEADFNIKLDIFKINTNKYDLNMAFSEEEQIKDHHKRTKYRKAKYEYLSGKDKIYDLLSRMKKEISENQSFIYNYGRGTLLMK